MSMGVVEIHIFDTLQRTAIFPFNEEISIVPCLSVFSALESAVAEITYQPVGTRMRSKVCFGLVRAGKSISASTSPWLSLDCTYIESGPKAVGARSTRMVRPSSNHLLGVANSKRNVSGSPSSSESQSCTSRWRRTASHCPLLALFGGQ